jgi:uncharacterized membrane protein
MNRVEFKDLVLRSNRFTGWAPKFHRALFVLFLLQFALVWARLWWPRPLLGSARWPDGLLLVLTAAALIASVTRELPGQNVIQAAVIIGCGGGAAHTLGALTGIPFGSFTYGEAIGQKLFHPLPWTVPLMWISAILASRGVARLLLRPWRKTPNYGYRVIGVTTLLVLLLDAGLEPFATLVKHYWVWDSRLVGPKWCTAPWVNFLGWAVTTLLILAFATPSFINKAPRPRPPPEYSSLVVWLLLNLLFGTGAALYPLWPAVGFVSISSVVVAVLAWRGARW